MTPLLARTYWVAVHRNGDVLQAIDRSGQMMTRPSLYQQVATLKQALQKRTDVDDPREWRAVAVRISLEAAE